MWWFIAGIVVVIVAVIGLTIYVFKIEATDWPVD